MAAGAGRRFRVSGGEGLKLLAPLGGVPVLEHTLASIPRDALDAVVVTASPEVAALARRLGFESVAPRGSLRSDTVRAGVAFAQRRGWHAAIFLPGDQPLVRAESLLALARAGSAQPDRACRLAWQGAPASPVLFSASAFPLLMSIEGNDGGGALLRSGTLGCMLVEAADPVELLDIDTVDDLARAGRLLA